MTDRDLTDLHPTLQPIADEWLENCESIGLNVKIIVTWRSAADQNECESEGLSNAGAGQSPHNVCDAKGNPASCAFDFGVFTPSGAYVTDGTDLRYAQCGAIGKKLGLVYGGDWHHPDEDHLELSNWKEL